MFERGKIYLQKNKKQERIWTRLTFFKFPKDNTALIW